MSSSRIRYTDKFKRDAVMRVLAGHPLSHVAGEVKVSEGLLHRWVNAASSEATRKKRSKETTTPPVNKGGRVFEVSPSPESLGQDEPPVALEVQLERVQADLRLVEQANAHLQERLRLAERGNQKDYAENRLLRALTVLLLGQDKNLDSQLAP